MYSFNIFAILSLAASFACLFLGIYILLRNPKSQANRLFALASLSLFFWGLGEGMERAAMNFETTFFWTVYILGLGSAFYFPFLLHFWLVFSGQLEIFRNKVLIFILYFLSLIFTFIRFIHPEILLVGLKYNYWGYSADDGTFCFIFMLYIFLCNILFVYLAFRTAAKSYGKMKKQAQYIGGATIFSLFIGAATQLSRPLFHFPIPGLTIVSTIVIVGFIAYAINRYGLMVISAKLVAENIIGTMEDYVIAIDKEMKIVYINNSVLQDFGYKENELINKPISAIILADISKFSYEQALKQFPLLNYQAEIISKKGDKITVSANVSILEESSSDILGFVFVFRDVRQMDKLIKGLQQKTEELEVAKKELEKKNEEFESTNEKLDQTNKLMVGRELKMAELKKEIEELKGKTKRDIKS
jgi:PAS domain S-box-containing protein